MKVEHQNKRKEMWINAWSCVACVNPSSATALADEALKDFDERFKEEVEDAVKEPTSNDGTCSTTSALTTNTTNVVDWNPITNGQPTEEGLRQVQFPFTNEDAPIINFAEKHIRELNLSTRAFSPLFHNKIRFISDLISHTREELLAFNNFGKLSLLEVEHKLMVYGLKLKSNSTITQENIKPEDRTIKSLKFSTRTYNALEHNKINLVSDLIKCSKNKLLNFRNLGYLSLNEIETKLNYLGLKLKQRSTPEKPKFLQILNQKAQERGLNLSEYMKILLNETSSKEHKG
jgi:DNA-directed RNA polymerase alpha subunit